MNVPLSVLERQTREREWHNQKYKTEIDWGTSRGMTTSYRYFWQTIGSVNGLKILDFGCGNGWVSIKCADAGATVCGIDIAEELIDKGRRWVAREGLSEKVSLQVMAGEALNYPDKSFDLVIGSAVLHHTDLNLALNGIHRVLRSGGKAIFIEPLNQNIALKIWRFMTPWRRSPTERALSRADLRSIKSVFSTASFHFFGLSSMVTEGLQMILGQARLVGRINAFFEKMDRSLIALFPGLGPYFAVCVMELIKDAEQQSLQ